MNPFIGALVGLAAGLLAGCGLGGGAPLMLYLSLTGLPQQAVQGAGLLCFLPAALTALWGHIRTRGVDWPTVPPAAAGGLATAALGAFLAQNIDGVWLRRLFGLLLLIMGLRELLTRPADPTT
ncbi:MAG: TSUP family transporter [Oscillospiraceae bacterium]|jgi:uncharacterized membrane protein YfcA|nr:TSUP family transporter [Oscillospiraceae bacterium]